MTDTNRRNFLAAAAVLPVAAAIPAEAMAATNAAPVVTPASVPKPYTNYVWQWFVSHDGETYYEAFEKASDAIEYARQNEYSIVAECRQQDFDLSIDAYWIIERINDNNEERIGEGEGIECTQEQEADLERMVQAAVEAWVVKHRIDIRAWSFDGARNEQRVDG